MDKIPNLILQAGENFVTKILYKNKVKIKHFNFIFI